MALTEQHSATQKTILAAALKRVAKFGYTKTTMCEIASDVEMSPANIYRHFKSKQAILKSCAERFLEERFSVLQLIVEDKNKTATKKIKDYVLTLARVTQELTHGESHMPEVANIVTLAYPELRKETIKRHQDIINTILLQGVENKEFKKHPSPSSIAAFHIMLTVFEYPFLCHLYSKIEFENHAKEVAKVLIDALK